MVLGHGRGVSSVATQFVPVFLACCPVCLGRHAGEFFVAFLRFAAQTSVAAGQKKESVLSRLVNRLT